MPPPTRLRGAVFAALLVLSTACNPFGGDDVEPTTTLPPPPTAPVNRAGLSIDGVLKLGAVLPLTGELERLGPGLRAAVELAVDEVNDAGGVLGHDVELFVEDSHSTADGAVAAARRLINASLVDALVGPLSTMELVPGVVDQAREAERAVCSPGTSSGHVVALDEMGLVFSMTPEREGAAVVVSDLLEAGGHRRIAVVRHDDAETTAVHTELLVQLEADVGAGAYELTEVVAAADAEPDVAPVVAAAPDSVVLLLSPTAAAPVVRALFDAALLPSQGSATAVFVVETLASDDLGAAADPEKPALLNGVQGVRPEALPGEARAFAARLRAETAVRVTDLAAEAYDCAVLAILGAVGGDDPVAMAGRLPGLTRDGEPCDTVVACRDALQAGSDVRYATATGVEWNDDGHPVRGVFEHFTFGDRGQITPVGRFDVLIGVDGQDAAPVAP